MNARIVTLQLDLHKTPKDSAVQVENVKEPGQPFGVFGGTANKSDQIDTKAESGRDSLPVIIDISESSQSARAQNEPADRDVSQVAVQHSIQHPNLACHISLYLDEYRTHPELYQPILCISGVFWSSVQVLSCCESLHWHEIPMLAMFYRKRLPHTILRTISALQHNCV